MNIHENHENIRNSLKFHENHENHQEIIKMTITVLQYSGTVVNKAKYSGTGPNAVVNKAKYSDTGPNTVVNRAKYSGTGCTVPGTSTHYPVHHPITPLPGHPPPTTRVHHATCRTPLAGPGTS